MIPTIWIVRILHDSNYELKCEMQVGKRKSTDLFKFFIRFNGISSHIPDGNLLHRNSNYDQKICKWNEALKSLAKIISKQTRSFHPQSFHLYELPWIAIKYESPWPTLLRYLRTRKQIEITDNPVQWKTRSTTWFTTCLQRQTSGS